VKNLDFSSKNGCTFAIGKKYNRKEDIMKMSRLLSVILLGVTLIAATPIYAQRGGGGRSGGSSSSHSSSGGSRSSGGSFSSSSRGSSSSSRSSSSFSSSSSRSSSSYSSSPSRSSSSSYSSSSRSSSSFSSPSSSSRSSSSSGSYSGTSGNSSSFGGLRSSGGAGGQRLYGSSDAPATSSRTGSVPTQMRSSQTGARQGAKATTTGREDAVRSNASGVRSEGDASRNTNGQVGGGRPSGVAPVANGGGSGHHPHPGPDPYFMHPHYHHMVHCHQIYWDPFPPRPFYWPGFWLYCDSYWYDYHVTDIVVVREYLKDTYNMELVAYAIGGEYMYALINDRDGHTYLQVYDKNDKLLAEQQVSHKYIKMEVDPQNGGCWIMKKRDKDPLLFLYADGQLLIYEADK